MTQLQQRLSRDTNGLCATLREVLGDDRYESLTAIPRLQPTRLQLPNRKRRPLAGACGIHCRDYRVRHPGDRLALYTAPAARSRPTIEEHQMADNQLSEKFDALSEKAKESANKLKASAGREEGSTESGRRRSARACRRDRRPVRGEGGRRLR